MIMSFMLYIGPQSEAEQAIEILDNFVNSSELYRWDEALSIKRNDATFMDWHGPATDKVGGNAFLVSRLIQTENIDTEEARRKTAEAIAATKLGLFNFSAGKGVMDANADETSVLPAWRKTVGHYVA